LGLKICSGQRQFDKNILKAERLIKTGLVLEGGGIESDGKGTLMTTSECLLSPNRNPHLTKDEIDARLKALFGVNRILWLNNGYLAGDDTDSHIDTLARLCDEDTICYVKCDDTEDEHYPALKDMEDELKAFRKANGEPYKLVALPMADACFDEEGQRLPATYANFLIINGAVLVPTYKVKQDAAALEILRGCFPKHEIIGLDCLPLIWQHGSLHCISMQYPEGVV
jgi:agmatine deiminase